jgi:cell wall-associated NlpC family hydrolase
MSDEQRKDVVAEARSWLKTPYHHAADVKGHGVDCAMLLVRVYCDLRLVDRFDPRPYTRDWFLHRNEERYLGFLLERSREVRSPGLGDIVLFRVGRCFAHAGIVSSVAPLTIIHAFSNTGCVVEDVVESNSELAGRIKNAKFASYWG